MDWMNSRVEQGYLCMLMYFSNVQVLFLVFSLPQFLTFFQPASMTSSMLDAPGYHHGYHSPQEGPPPIPSIPPVSTTKQTGEHSLAHFFHETLDMKIIWLPFFLFHCFKKSFCQLALKEMSCDSRKMVFGLSNHI